MKFKFFWQKKLDIDDKAGFIDQIEVDKNLSFNERCDAVGTHVNEILQTQEPPEGYDQTIIYIKVREETKCLSK